MPVCNVGVQLLENSSASLSVSPLNLLLPECNDPGPLSTGLKAKTTQVAS